MAGDNRTRAELIFSTAAAAVLTLAIAFPFLRDEFAATAAHHAGAPIAFRPFAVLGQIVPVSIRPYLDLAAYWLILPAIEFPAIFFAGIAGAVAARHAPSLPSGLTRGLSEREERADRRLVIAFALLAGVSFAVPWVFASTIANNDLGWRGVLPGILILTAFAASGLARGLAAARPWAFGTVVLWALGLTGGLQVARDNAVGLPTPAANAFAQTPALWAAVRRHTAPDERVANNPAFLADSVRWPINISWALLADRPSCYAGWNLARAFVPLPEAEIDATDALFRRVFAGDGTRDEVRRVAADFDCRVVVVTPRDGAWLRDPFAAEAYFRLVEERAGKWRIYRIAGDTEHPE